GQVGQELVGDLDVRRRDDGVQPALLAVEVPAAVVHHVAHRADVDALRAGRDRDLHHARDGVARDPQAVDGGDAAAEAGGGLAHLAGEAQVAVEAEVADRRPGGGDRGGRPGPGGRRRTVQPAGPAVVEEVLAAQQL